MRKSLLFVLVTIILSGCGVTLDSVVQSGLTKTYNNPLIVIPYEKNQTEYFALSLKRNFEKLFATNSQKIEVLLVEATKQELVLNSADKNETKINTIVDQDHKDLILFFKPVRFEYNNDILQNAYYEITGIDTETKNEVWKAHFSSKGTFGPSTFAKGSTQMIFRFLQEDKILK